MSVDLKPCPWCEDDTIFDAEIREARHYFCENCGASGPVNDEDGSLWNTRAPDPAVAALEAEMARLRAALEVAKGFIEKNPALTGMCCCGDYMKDHDGYEGHGAVDSGFYAALLTVEEIDRALNPVPSEKEAG